MLDRRHRSLLLILPVVFATSYGCGSFITWSYDHVLSSEVRNPKPLPKPVVPATVSGERSLPFLVVGDAGTGGKGQRIVAEGMARKASADSAAFVLYLGDNFYYEGVSSVDDEQFQTKFEQMYTAPSLQIPFYAVLGNHDHRQNPDAEVAYTAHSTRWKMPARYFTTTEAVDDSTSVQFFFLDTKPLTTFDGEEDQVERDTSLIGREMVWLDSTLARSKAQWKVVVGHHALYSGGVHGDNTELTALLEPLFVRYGVDLYLAGHDHHMEMRRPVKGVQYIVSGAGSLHRDVTWGPGTLYAATNLGFAWCRMSASAIVAEFFDGEGTLRYVTTLEKNSGRTR